MDEFNVTELATSGATMLVAEMVRSSWEAVRGAMVGIFRHGSEDRAAEEIHDLDLRHESVVQSSEEERAAVEERVHGMLFIQLAGFLQRHPAAAAELFALVEEKQDSESASGTGPVMTAKGNTGSQVLMAGGSITGSVSFRGEPTP
ncbi:hypothetical protein [Streptomyces sp. NBC_00347]|uniref:hypothetical protein n=1 Tax=Streptomyces sp. NBC_00347 TaxID=2975721 RepID=UPI0022543F45|nr:hypothetical protein [Streptomyces sp. NBC_00347]MCX5124640.1 hypothetical protein [Streptomyces sp. NBC_00347]